MNDGGRKVWRQKKFSKVTYARVPRRDARANDAIKSLPSKALLIITIY